MKYWCCMDVVMMWYWLPPVPFDTIYDTPTSIWRAVRILFSSFLSSALLFHGLYSTPNIISWQWCYYLPTSWRHDIIFHDLSNNIHVHDFSEFMENALYGSQIQSIRHCILRSRYPKLFRAFLTCWIWNRRHVGGATVQIRRATVLLFQRKNSNSGKNKGGRG